MSIPANRPHPKRGRSLTQYLRIPPEKMPQSCRIAYVNEAIVDRQDGSRRIFSLDIPEGVAVRHNEEGLVWWVSLTVLDFTSHSRTCVYQS